MLSHLFTSESDNCTDCGLHRTSPDAETYSCNGRTREDKPVDLASLERERHSFWDSVVLEARKKREERSAKYPDTNPTELLKRIKVNKRAHDEAVAGLDIERAFDRPISFTARLGGR